MRGSRGRIGHRHRRSPVLARCYHLLLPTLCPLRPASSRDLRGVDQSDSPPSDPEQPRARAGDRRVVRLPERCARAIEPAAGRGRVDASGSGDQAASLEEVASRVEQHIGQRVPHLARRAKDPSVEAVGENGTAAPEDAIDRASYPRTDRLHAAGQVSGARRLDDHVYVVALDRVVDQTAAGAFAHHSKAALELPDEAPRASEGTSLRTFNVT